MGTSEPTPPGSDDGEDERDAEEGDQSIAALREQVEQKYDFDDFGPEDMEQMTAEEWEAAFDPDSWVTGPELLDRVEADLKQRVIDRDVFARIERHEEYILAYSDAGFAVVYPDGSIAGEGTVLRDTKPTVALASMESYDVPDVPEGEVLPTPAEVPEGGSELGNQMLQVVAFAQALAGLALVGAFIFAGATVIALVAGLFFLAIAFVLFFTVANARLSDRFRAEEFRDRLRAMNVGEGERPDYLPVDENGNLTLDRSEASGGLPEDVATGADGPPAEDGAAASEAADSPPETDADSE